MKGATFRVVDSLYGYGNQEDSRLQARSAELSQLENYWRLKANGPRPQAVLLIAGGFFILPSLFILMGLSWVYMAFGSITAVAGVLYGIKPAVTSIVVSAAYRIGTRALKNAWLWAVAAASFLAIFVANVPFPLIVLVAGIIGHFGGKYAPAKFGAGGRHKGADSSFGPAILDDNTPTPPHARFTWRRFITVLASFMVSARFRTPSLRS
jgi:chromate transporter